MAEPIIQYDASGGSDTAASGAGPATAITGSNAAHTFGAASTTINLTNSPDLSGVATDGSAVIWLGTGSGRRLSAITGVDNSAKTITVEDSFTILDGASAVDYAIGGKRQTLDSHTTPDWQDWRRNWTVQFESGLYEYAGSLTLSTNQFGVRLVAAPAAPTRPILRSSDNSHGITIATQPLYWLIRGLEVQASATRYCLSSPVFGIIKDCVFGPIPPDSRCSTGIFVNTSGTLSITGCVFDGCGTAIDVGGGRIFFALNNIIVRDCAIGFELENGTALSMFSVSRLLMYDIDDVGISYVGSRVDNLMIDQAVIYGCGSHGIEAVFAASEGIHITNSIIAGNGGWGFLNFEHANIENCIFHGNTSGNLDEVLPGVGTGASDADFLTDDPLFTNPAGEDFTLQSGSPAIGAGSNGQDIGYHQSATGGGGSPVTRGWAI